MICDEIDMLTKVMAISQGMCWETRWADHESGCSFNPQEDFSRCKALLAGFLTLQRAGFIKLNFPLVFWEGVPVLHRDYAPSLSITCGHWEFIERFIDLHGVGLHCATSSGCGIPRRVTAIFPEPQR